MNLSEYTIPTRPLVVISLRLKDTVASNPSPPPMKPSVGEAPLPPRITPLAQAPLKPSSPADGAMPAALITTNETGALTFLVTALGMGKDERGMQPTPHIDGKTECLL